MSTIKRKPDSDLESQPPVKQSHTNSVDEPSSNTNSSESSGNESSSIVSPDAAELSRQESVTSQSESSDSGSQSSSSRSHKYLFPEDELQSKDETTQWGIVKRDFYPPELSAERCEQYKLGKLETPMQKLQQALDSTADGRKAVEVGESVIHWFKRDIRTSDNLGLSQASALAAKNNVPLICLYIISPEDYEAHSRGVARIDFDRRCIEVLRDDLNKLNIPLDVARIDKRKDVVGHIISKCKEYKANHVFCNLEYEVDELRRETKLVKQALAENISVTALHDDVVVPPNTLHTQTNTPYAVYTPWFRAWTAYLHKNEHLLEEAQVKANSKDCRGAFKALFDEKTLPDLPEKFILPSEDRERLAELWPAGEHEAFARLQKFIAGKISGYSDNRDLPAANSTSALSMHFSAGTLAARTAIRLAKKANSNHKLQDGNVGISTWISEVAWRDFYKHALVAWPYICMNKPYKYEYAKVVWSYDMKLFQRWKDGKTGFPIIDAAMRQVKHMAYMHNRCRMIVASFLAKDLMIDWRLGERWFMENLIDGDFASNNGGWGFSAGCGLDPQPYFRIFNPTLQSEKFDREGDYIRKWVPELRNIEGKAIHDPYNRGYAQQAKAAGYPAPMVNHSEARKICIERYKEALAS